MTTLPSSSSHFDPIIAVDIGNSTCKIGLFLPGEPLPVHFIRLDYTEFENKTTETVHQKLTTFLDHPSRLDIGLCSVAPAHEHTIREVLTTWVKQKQKQPSIQECLYHALTRENLDHCHALSRIVDFSAYAHGQLGADRRMNMLAVAAHYVPGHYLVMDAGTMTKFDLIDTHPTPAHYKGGVISAGKHPERYGALLPTLPTQDAASCPGLNTNDALALGYVYQNGQHAPRAVAEIVSQLLEGVDWEAAKTHVLLTGGDAALFEHDAKSLLDTMASCTHVPSLTLQGIALATPCFRDLKDYNFVT